MFAVAVVGSCDEKEGRSSIGNAAAGAPERLSRLASSRAKKRKAEEKKASVLRKALSFTFESNFAFRSSRRRRLFFHRVSLSLPCARPSSGFPVSLTPFLRAMSTAAVDDDVALYRRAAGGRGTEEEDDDDFTDDDDGEEFEADDDEDEEERQLRVLEDEEDDDDDEGLVEDGAFF